MWCDMREAFRLVGFDWFLVGWTGFIIMVIKITETMPYMTDYWMGAWAANVVFMVYMLKGTLSYDPFVGD